MGLNLLYPFWSPTLYTTFFAGCPTSTMSDSADDNEALKALCYRMMEKCGMTAAIKAQLEEMDVVSHGRGGGSW
jgi:hypothetical protein